MNTTDFILFLVTVGVTWAVTWSVALLLLIAGEWLIDLVACTRHSTSAGCHMCSVPGDQWSLGRWIKIQKLRRECKRIRQAEELDRFMGKKA